MNQILCSIQQIPILSYHAIIYVFHFWVYSLALCIFAFFVVMAVGALYQPFFSHRFIKSEKTAPYIDTSKETIVQKTLLSVNMIFSFPTYSQVWCMGIFVGLFFFVCGPCGKTLLAIYYAHLFTDKSPSENGWDEDVPFLQCLLGLSGDWNSTRTSPKKHPTRGNSRYGVAVFQSVLQKTLFLPWKLRNVCRMSPNFELVRQYFDAELVRTVELKDADKRNYLFLYHPHGIMSAGASATLFTDVAGFPQLFPGVHRSTCALNACFLIPFFRDWMLANGFISANRSTIVRHLTTSYPFRKSIVLLPGGSAEALHAHPGVFRVYLKNRKGFIRVALQTGCTLVPCLGFGENEMFRTIYGHSDESYEEKLSDNVAFTRLEKALFKLQQRMTKILSFSVPIMTHVMPLRKKITVVVGEPMHFDTVCRPGAALDEDLVDKYHKRYCDKLHDLYNRYKGNYAVKDMELEIV